jgi:DNA-binding response OmpR family regulator
MAKILIVDDDPSILELLSFLISKQGHDVLTATDGKAGLEKAKAERPDLIVLDVMMPEMDGFGVSASLFKDRDMRDTPILILTAKGTSREIFKLVPNVRGYMDKPFDPPDLLKTIRQLLIKVV